MPHYLLLAGLSGALLYSAFIGRFSWAFCYFAAFVVLGFWMKLSLHTLFDYAYLEPTGAFAGLASEWSRFYAYINSALGGALIARWLMIRRWTGDRPVQAPVPMQASLRLNVGWALVLVAVIAAVYLFNRQAGFFVTGLAPSLILPFSLNAPAAFFVFLGMPLLLALFVGRCVRHPSQSAELLAMVVLFHGVAASVSTASRAIVVLQTLPLLIGMQRALVEQGRSFDRRVVLGGALALMLALVLVSLYRMQTYLDDDLDLGLAWGYFKQTLLLVSDRWIGVEALMVAASVEGTMALFVEAVVEPPALGVEGLYQQLAESWYTADDLRVFLTLPGLIGLLGLSGSLAVLGAGTFLAVISLHLLDRLMHFCCQGNPVYLSLAGCALANTLVQMSSFYLAAAFVIQLLLFTLMLGFVTGAATFSRSGGLSADGRRP